ncbi:unnamed protein product [Choristocarpus tenellus]
MNPNLGELFLLFCLFVEGFQSSTCVLGLNSDGERYTESVTPDRQWWGRPEEGPVLLLVNDKLLEDLALPAIAATLRRSCGAILYSLWPGRASGLPVWGNDPRWSLLGHALSGSGAGAAAAASSGLGTDSHHKMDKSQGLCYLEWMDILFEASHRNSSGDGGISSPGPFGLPGFLLPTIGSASATGGGLGRMGQKGDHYHRLEARHAFDVAAGRTVDVAWAELKAAAVGPGEKGGNAAEGIVELRQWQQSAMADTGDSFGTGSDGKGARSDGSLNSIPSSFVGEEAESVGEEGDVEMDIDCEEDEHSDVEVKVNVGDDRVLEGVGECAGWAEQPPLPPGPMPPLPLQEGPPEVIAAVNCGRDGDSKDNVGVSSVALASMTGVDVINAVQLPVLPPLPSSEPDKSQEEDYMVDREACCSVVGGDRGEGVQEGSGLGAGSGPLQVPLVGNGESCTSHQDKRMIKHNYKKSCGNAGDKTTACCTVGDTSDQDAVDNSGAEMERKSELERGREKEREKGRERGRKLLELKAERERKETARAMEREREEEQREKDKEQRARVRDRSREVTKTQERVERRVRDRERKEWDRQREWERERDRERDRWTRFRQAKGRKEDDTKRRRAVMDTRDRRWERSPAPEREVRRKWIRSKDGRQESRRVDRGRGGQGWGESQRWGEGPNSGSSSSSTSSSSSSGSDSGSDKGSDSESKSNGGERDYRRDTLGEEDQLTSSSRKRVGAMGGVKGGGSGSGRGAVVGTGAGVMQEGQEESEGKFSMKRIQERLKEIGSRGDSIKERLWEIAGGRGGDEVWNVGDAQDVNKKEEEEEGEILEDRDAHLMSAPVMHHPGTSAYMASSITTYSAQPSSWMTSSPSVVELGVECASVTAPLAVNWTSDLPFREQSTTASASAMGHSQSTFQAQVPRPIVPHPTAYQVTAEGIDAARASTATHLTPTSTSMRSISSYSAQPSGRTETQHSTLHATAKDVPVTPSTGSNWTVQLPLQSQVPDYSACTIAPPTQDHISSRTPTTYQVATAVRGVLARATPGATFPWSAPPYSSRTPGGMETIQPTTQSLVKGMAVTPQTAATWTLRGEIGDTKGVDPAGVGDVTLVASCGPAGRGEGLFMEASAPEDGRERVRQSLLETCGLEQQGDSGDNAGEGVKELEEGEIEEGEIKMTAPHPEGGTPHAPCLNAVSALGSSTQGPHGQTSSVEKEQCSETEVAAHNEPSTAKACFPAIKLAQGEQYLGSLAVEEHANRSLTLQTWTASVATTTTTGGKKQKKKKRKGVATKKSKKAEPSFPEIKEG